MNALAYLVVMQLKNRILTLRRKPARLISYIILALFVIMALVSSGIGTKRQQPAEFADERILFLIIVAVGLLFFGLYINSGLSTGSTLFSMADAGLLFPAPISPKKILLYGLVSTFGKTLAASLFILYQVGNLRSGFGYGAKEISALFLIYIMMLMFGQLVSIAVYVFCHGDSRRRAGVRTIAIAALIGLLLVVLNIHRQHGQGIETTVDRVLDGLWFECLPMGGWALMFFKGVVRGSAWKMAMSLALFAASGAAILAYLAQGRADYYEEVLVSTEHNYKLRLAALENKNYTGKARKKVRIKDAEKGLKSAGAAAIAYRQILEATRSNRLPFVNGFTIVAALTAFVTAKAFQGFAAGKYIAFALLTYLQYFTARTGPLKTELTKPHLYLIPERSYKKLLAGSVVSFVKPCTDAVVIFTVFAASGGTDPVDALFLALAYAATGAVYTGMAVVSHRVLGGQPALLLRGILGSALLLVIMLPAIGSAVITAVLLPSGLDHLCMLPYFIVCMISAFVMFILCADLLDHAEFSG
ncbi:MAG TPA: putative ABC exporter domain-containing protein [Candidatus Atribacteria bacterium]|nr:putative ABC exporter domain-containing protein [Candidatus Atribacteria bacterium]